MEVVLQPHLDEADEFIYHSSLMGVFEALPPCRRTQ